MQTSNLIERDSVRARVTAVTKDDVLRVAADLLAPRLPNGVEVLEGLKRREALGSTGMADGVALPHCGLDYEGPFVVAVLTTGQPVAFGAVDGAPSQLFVAIAGPERDRSGHIRILAAIGKHLRDKAIVDELIAIKSDDALYDRITQRIVLKEDPDGSRRFSRVTIRLEDEERLADILELISSEPGSSVSVTEGRSAGRFMRRMPLFATFWGSEDRTTIYTIDAIVPRGQVNSLVRKIEQPGLPESGVVVAVNELSYAAGRIDG